MTIKKAIKIGEMFLYKQCDLECTIRASTYSDNDIWNVTKMAFDALEAQEKNKWHDLRKNPKDLPEKEKLLLAFVEEENTYYCAEYDSKEFIRDAHHAFFEMGTGMELFYQPIAWRYIEPFAPERGDK